MAPRTRSSVGVGDVTANSKGSANLEVAAKLQDLKVSAGPPKRGRGRPPKKQTLVAAAGGRSNSTSSAPTPATLISDGEYSTPATSSSATPAPPTEGVADQSGLPRQGRLKMELPSEDEGNDDDEADGDYSSQTSKPKSSRVSTTVRSKRLRNIAPSYTEDGDDVDADENEINDPKQAASIALARQLQEEEDQAAELAILVTRERVTQFPENKRKRGSSNVNTNSKRQKISISDLVHLNNSPQSPDPDDLSDGPSSDEEDMDSSASSDELGSDSESESESESDAPIPTNTTTVSRRRSAAGAMSRLDQYNSRTSRRARSERKKLESNHPELTTMWVDLENMPSLNAGTAPQPAMISLQLKPFQLQGLAWMKAMEQTRWRGGLLGDEMGLGKTIQAVSLIVSDYPAKAPSLVLLPPVALGQWQDEIAAYTDNRLKTIVFHGTNAKAKNLSVKELKKFDVIIMSYNSLESLYRKQEKGVKRKDGLYKEKSVVHQIKFHRVILDEAHCIKVGFTFPLP